MLSWSRLLNYQEFCELVVRHNSYQKVKVCTHIMKYIKKKVNTQRSLFPSFYWTFIYALRLFMFIVFIRRKQYVTHASLPALHSVMTQCGSLKLTTVGTFMLQKLKNATNRAWHIVLMIVQISDTIIDNILTVQVKFKHAVSVAFIVNREKKKWGNVLQLFRNYYLIQQRNYSHYWWMSEVHYFTLVLLVSISENINLYLCWNCIC